MIHQAEFDQTIHDLISEVKVSQFLASDESTYDSYQQILQILSSLNFSTRANAKGVLSHFVVDSYTGDFTLGERLIKFDQKL